MDNSAYIAELENEFGEQKNGTSQVYTHSFDEALGLTRVGRFHYMLMLISGLCFLAVMTETLCMGIIIPFVKCDLEASEAEQGLLASAGFFGIMLSSHTVGFLADTAGRVRTLRYSLTFAAATTIIAAFSVNTWMLIAFRFLNGFFISGCQACVFSLVGEFHSNKTRVRYVTLLAIFLPLALVILPAVGLVILPLQFDSLIFGMRFTSWRLFFLINTTLSFLGLAGLCTLPETPKYMLVHGNHDAALNTLRSIYSKNTGDKPENFPVKSIVLQAGGANLVNIKGVGGAFKMIWSQTMPLFYKKRCLQTMSICFSLFVTFGVSEGLFMWFPTILNELIAKNSQGLKVCEIIGSMEPIAMEPNANDCSGSIDNFMFEVLMMCGGVFILVFIIFAYTIDIVGKVNLLIIWLVICCVCAVITHWLSEFAAAVIALTLLMSIGNCSGIISTLSVEFYPTEINAMGMCFAMMIGRLGSVAGGNLIGLFLFKFCDIVFWAIVGIIATLIALATVLPEKKRERK